MAHEVPHLGNFYPGPAHLQQTPQHMMTYYNPYGATNNTAAMSDYSQGGLTSKRSHKHLLDSANQPLMSKQECETQGN